MGLSTSHFRSSSPAGRWPKPPSPATLPVLLEQWARLSSVQETLRHGACLLNAESATLFVAAYLTCPRPLTGERKVARANLGLDLACSPDVRLAQDARTAFVIGAAMNAEAKGYTSLQQVYGDSVGLLRPDGAGPRYELGFSGAQITGKGLARRSSDLSRGQRRTIYFCPVRKRRAVAE